MDDMLRLLAAAGTGILVGINRDISGKPLGMRTLSLVALGAALAALSGVEFQNLRDHPDAVARVIQGTITGVLTGVGFIGAGVVLRDLQARAVYGLTTAATVWVTAALGVGCALAAWPLVGTAVAITLIVLFGLSWIERVSGLRDPETSSRFETVGDDAEDDA
jgi:putative Mg2+ transporter-C (MgtC) family protein